MDDLALQIAGVDGIEVDCFQALLDARRGEIQRERRAESAGTHTENLRRLELLLAFHADFGQDQV